MLLECAFFLYPALTARRQPGLHTDYPSHRYERGVDPACSIKHWSDLSVC
ncbi:hypothetical protein MJ561_17590 [Klebsiella pneumoniae]|nr:hypothetical protein MJ561_17590 [Klebsiella pneumoniae]